jgi:DNA-binding LacI/PurR family transcriptional regulator
MNDTTKISTKVTLRTVAEHVGLTPGTISAVLNNTSAADRIPQHTRDRVIAAARELNYSPNPLARALRSGKSAIQRDQTPGVSPMRGALVILDSEQFGRALSAIQQAGFKVPDEVSVVDLFDGPLASDHPTVATAPHETAKLS